MFCYFKNIEFLYFGKDIFESQAMYYKQNANKLQFGGKLT